MGDTVTRFSGWDAVFFVDNKVVGEIQSVRVKDYDPVVFGLGGPNRVIAEIRAVYYDRDPMAGVRIGFNITIPMINEYGSMSLARRVVGCNIVRRTAGVAADDVVIEVSYLAVASAAGFMAPFIPSQVEGFVSSGVPLPADWPTIDLSRDPVDYTRPVEPVGIEETPLRGIMKWLKDPEGVDGGTIDAAHEKWEKERPEVMSVSGDFISEQDAVWILREANASSRSGRRRAK